MATKRPARASPELREAPLSPRYHPELHHPMGHCSGATALGVKNAAFAATGITEKMIPKTVNGRTERANITNQ